MSSKWVKTILVILITWSSTASAQLVFRNGFEEPDILPIFPVVNGEFQLTSGPAPDQLTWVLSELAAGETTTLAEIEARFAPVFNFNNLVSFFESLRGQFPNAVVTEVVSVTPLTTVVLVETPEGSDPQGLFQLNADFGGSNLINFFSVANLPAASNGQFFDDLNLTLEEAGDKFTTFSSDPGLLVARIEDNGECTPILDRNASTLFATGSVFKEWVLGGAAMAVEDGLATRDQIVPLVQTERAVVGGETVNREPNGTPFTLEDIARLMIGISDNTATDLLHEAVGRDIIDEFIGESGVADPSVLQPILSTTEMFHLYWSFSLSDAWEYINGSEVEQRQFLQDRIVPLSNIFNFPFANDPILTAGTWRASPLDICATLSSLRQFPLRSDPLELVDQVMSTSTAFLRLRNRWDRVWHKGGSLSSGSTGQHVLAYSWLLEDNGRPPFVVVAMANDPSGGLDTADGDGFSNVNRINSIVARILDIVTAGL